MRSFNHWFAVLIPAALVTVTSLAGASELKINDHKGSISGTPEQTRERIGLVLGGGSARGIAHIGVIKALEALRIPVDVVAGSSMGSVVGALYAAGYSGAEIEKFAVNQDWTAIFDDSTVRERATFRRKTDDVGFLADGYLSFEGGTPVLPDGVVQGQSLWLTLSKLMADARSVSHFDELPIPFRAVAMDLSTGSVVTLEKGDLAAATLASMALPGLIPPVEIDGRRLIDGGFIDNLPVSTARDMGSDRVLVVSVGSDALPADSIKGFGGVLRQTQKLLTDPSVRAQRASLLDTDILIEPVLDEFGFASFSDAETMIDRGEEAVRALESILLPLALNEQDWLFHINDRARIKAARPLVSAFDIEQNSSLSDQLVRDFLDVEIGSPLDPVSLGADIEDLYATGLFERISYDVDPLGKLTLRARAYSTQLSFYRFGLALDSDLSEGTRFALGMSYTRPQVNRRGGEYRGKVTIGDITRVVNEFYQPFGKRQRYFVEPSLLLTRGNSSFFDDGDLPVGAQREGLARIGIDGGILFDRWGELRFGVRYGSSDLESVPVESAQGVVTDSTNLPGENDASAFIRFTIDSLDELSWPHVGTLATISHTEHLDVADAELDYSETEFVVLKPITRGANTLTLQAAISSTEGADSDTRVSARLGGFLKLSGFSMNELRGQHSLLVSGTYYRRVNPRSILFDLPIYIGGSLEAGDVFTQRSDISLDGLTVAGSAYVGLDSPIGPVYLGYGTNDQDSERFYFSVGSFFR
ncbi:MAG: patatin-like phospholipase family protein [Granulosicoccus sp.]